MTVNSTDEFTVVIVTYNSAHCLPSLSRSLSKLKNIIFVDNASEDKTTESINSFFPQAKIISLEKNLGFGAANNKALALVQTPYALLLNPDCETKEDFFSKSRLFR